MSIYLHVHGVALYPCKPCQMMARGLLMKQSHTSPLALVIACHNMSKPQARVVVKCKLFFCPPIQLLNFVSRKIQSWHLVLTCRQVVFEKVSKSLCKSNIISLDVMHCKQQDGKCSDSNVTLVWNKMFFCKRKPSLLNNSGGLTASTTFIPKCFIV